MNDAVGNFVHKTVYGPHVHDLVVNGGANLPDGYKFTVGRNGRKKEISEAEVIEKYLERKASNGEFIETMKVTYSRTAAGPSPVGPSETRLARLTRRHPPPRIAHAHLGPQ